MTPVPRLARAILLGAALPAAAIAQPTATPAPRVTVGVGVGPTSLANLGTGRAQQRAGTFLSLTTGVRLTPRLTLRIDGTVASVRTMDILRLGTAVGEVDTLPPIEASPSMLGASLQLEGEPFADVPLRLRAGPTYLHAEAPSFARPTPQPRLDPLARASGFGWRVGASLPIGNASSAWWISADAMRANSNRGAMWLVPIGVELRFR